MPIRINVRELLEILDVTPAAQNILLVGRHGIGKSEILTRHYAARGLLVVPLFLGQMSDPGDLLGLPTKDDASGRTIFLPPYWWPLDGRPVALFLDELNRARPEILQSVHDLALNRTLAGRRLPEGSVVVSAVNAGEEYQVTDLDPALASRFNIYELAPEVDEWIAWARASGVDRRVVDFIQHNGVHLEQSGPMGDALDKAPDRRAWVRVAALVAPHATLTPVLVKALAGVVGAPAAVAFHKFLGEKNRVSPEDVLLRLDDTLAATLRALSVQDLVNLNRDVLHYVEDQAPSLKPARQKKIVAGVERYLDLMRSGRQTEVVADFINLTERPELARASALLLGSPALLQLLTDYVDKVKL
jgi:AAA domain (dynein-related subfamily)